MFSKNRKTNKTVAEVVLGLIALQALGVLAIVNFDLSRLSVATYSIATLLTGIGAAYVAYGVHENKLGG